MNFESVPLNPESNPEKVDNTKVKPGEGETSANVQNLEKLENPEQIVASFKKEIEDFIDSRDGDVSSFDLVESVTDSLEAIKVKYNIHGEISIERAPGGGNGVVETDEIKINGVPVFEFKYDVDGDRDTRVSNWYDRSLTEVIKGILEQK